MLTKIFVPLKNFCADRSAVAAIEFAMIVPLLAFFMLAEFDTYRYIMATQRLEIVAETVGQMFASATANPSAATAGDGAVVDSDISWYVNSSYFIYPDILSSPAVLQGASWWKAMYVSATAIKMTPVNGGGYTPVVVWRAGIDRTNNPRQCNTIFTIGLNTDVPSGAVLPTGVIGPNSIIVIDVQTTFQPTFGASFLSPITILRSVFMTPRNVPFIEYLGTGAMASNC